MPARLPPTKKHNVWIQVQESAKLPKGKVERLLYNNREFPETGKSLAREFRKIAKKANLDPSWPTIDHEWCKLGPVE